jgi:predicted DCC family thiol-disulfide oxidoreductase YuxK
VTAIEATALARRVNGELLTTDSLMAHLEARVAALEAIVATPWPWRLAAAWRLGRALRRSVRHFPGNTFAEKRVEAVSNDWYGRPEQLKDLGPADPAEQLKDLGRLGR